MSMNWHTPVTPAKSDSGSALVIALVGTMLLSSVGIGLVVLANTETVIAGNFRAASEALYGADALAEHVAQDLASVPQWGQVLAGAVSSSFTDGTLTPVTPAGTPLSLVALGAAVQAQSDASAAWGANNPQWRLFASGPVSDLPGPSAIENGTYVAAWVADDPSETDNDPAADANGVVMVQIHAFGVRGTHRIVEITVARRNTPAGPVGVRVLSWREYR
jgi:hypothetical protein